MFAVSRFLAGPRSNASRSLSSLAPGHILSGTLQRYRILEPIKANGSHQTAVFKAEVLPNSPVPSAPKWAVIKAVMPAFPNAAKNTAREQQVYRLSGISTAACFRQMYDVIDDTTIALEWLDTTLEEVKYQPNNRIYSLIGAFLDAALRSCVILDNNQHVNTDLKPANMLISGLGTDHLIAKVGDLDAVYPSNSRRFLQPLAMRAPEVYLGQTCNAPSQVWAIAAMILCWIRPSVLGALDSPHWIIDSPWSMSKLMRLFPDWKLPRPDEVESPEFKAAIETSERMSREEEHITQIATLQEELEKEKMPQQLRDLLQYILEPDPGARPSAAHILASDEFRAFQNSIIV